MTVVAPIDENSRNGLYAKSSANDGTFVDLWANPISHRLLTDSAAGGSGITSINTDTTATQTLTVGTTGTDFAIVDNGTGDHKFNLPSASATARGVITTGNQIIAGTKFFTGGIDVGASNQLTIDSSGNLITSGTFSGTSANLSGLTASSAVATDASKNLVSVTNTGTGNNVLATSPTLSSPIVGTQATTDNSTLAASTAYVTTAIANAVAGVNPAVAVTAATTQASDTSALTYNNGVSGIGATFTGSNNTALTIDGVTFTALGQRLLVKNDTQSPSGAFNGIYYVTQIQTAILPPILTRALDYDQPSDMNNTGAIPVISGTVNANTSWLLTSTVVTVGTTPLTFVQFSLAPTTIVTLTGTQTLTNKRVTKRVVTTTQSATPIINTDNTDVAYITGLAQAVTSFTTNLSGTPLNGDTLIIDVTDNGTGRALTFGTSFEASTIALPTTTVSFTKLTIGFRWNIATSKWTCVAVA